MTERLIAAPKVLRMRRKTKQASMARYCPSW